MFSHLVSLGTVFGDFLLFYLLRLAKYTAYSTLFNYNKIVMIILLAGTWHQIWDIYARPVQLPDNNVNKVRVQQL